MTRSLQSHPKEKRRTLRLAPIWRHSATLRLSPAHPLPQIPDAELTKKTAVPRCWSGTADPRNSAGMHPLAASRTGGHMEKIFTKCSMSTTSARHAIVAEATYHCARRQKNPQHLHMPIGIEKRIATECKIANRCARGVTGPEPLVAHDIPQLTERPMNAKWR